MAARSRSTSRSASAPQTRSNPDDGDPPRRSPLLPHPSPHDGGLPERAVPRRRCLRLPLMNWTEVAEYHRMPTMEQRVTESNGAGRRTVRILVVEDEPSISGFVRRGLHFEGYHVDRSE